MVFTTADFVAEMQRIIDGPVRYGSTDCPCRCEPFQCHCSDCSGSIVAALHACGQLRDVDCTGSFDLARRCHRAGGGIRLSQTRPGDLVFLGIHEGQGGIPGQDPGHVAVVKSNDAPHGQGRTLECRNHRAGCTEANLYGRGWAYCSRNIWLPQPGDDTTPPPAPKPQEAPVACIAVKGGWARPDLVNDDVILEGGARVGGDHRAEMSGPDQRYRWRPPETAVPFTSQLVDIFEVDDPGIAFRAVFQLPNRAMRSYAALHTS